MNQTIERLHDIEKNGYQLDFANVFNHAFENYKKIALYAGLVIFIFAFIFTLIYFMSFGLYLKSISLDNVNNQLIENLQHQKSLDAPLVSMVFSILILSLLMAPFSAGFYKMAEHADHDKEFKFINMFNFYRNPYFINIIIATILNAIINMLISTTIISLLNLININQFGLTLLANYSVSFFVYVLTFLTIPLIIFGDLKAIPAIKHSILIVIKQPIVLIGLMVVAIIGAFVGIMGCCIGLFFTIPFLYSMNYAIYTAIVGIDAPQDTE
ncbi:hypothetical protein [Flavobacterium taihuense]|uniref:Integral membrane protein n=1 Tax=Flavobacterium taihuense TaxID=2857508 RepID=A0ABS6XWC2_9FLAO|nr:hypothetical protein [Flavobacterium taihuense]MBW4360974.1 hypothetical protein [Flavobacterium taihuense]